METVKEIRGGSDHPAGDRRLSVTPGTRTHQGPKRVPLRGKRKEL